MPLFEDEKRLITKSEIQEQTGILVPPRIKEFMFEGWLNEVKEHQGKLEYIHTESKKMLTVSSPT